MLRIALPLALLTAVCPLLAQDTPTTITEELTVQEKTVLVHWLSDDRATQGEVTVRVGGVDQLVTRVERVDPKHEPWNLMIWFDQELIAPGVIGRSATALGQRASALCDLGFVTVVVADPEPRTLISGTRKPLDLNKVLSDLAFGVRHRKDALSWSRPDQEEARTRWERLPDELSLYASSSPQALIFIGAESVASTEDLKSLAGASPGDARPFALAVRKLGRELALRRWVAVGLVLRDSTLDRAVAPNPMEDAREQMTGETRYFIDLLNVFGAKGGKKKFRKEGAIEPYLLPRLAPVLTVVQLTGGTMVSFDEQIDPAIEELRSSWRIWFRITDLALAGEQPIEISATSEDGYSPRPPHWIQLGSAP